MKETIGQPLFPVRIRIAQGHNARLVNSEEADYLLATAWYSNLNQEEAEARSSEFGVTVSFGRRPLPNRIYHRTTVSGLESISGRCNPRCQEIGPGTLLFLSYRLNDARYQSGMRSNMPVEIAIDTFKAMGGWVRVLRHRFRRHVDSQHRSTGLYSFSRGHVQKGPPLYVAESTEATLTGEPAFRAKRDYEEAASSSSMAPPVAKAPVIKPTAAKTSAPKPTAKKMPTNKMPVEEIADAEVPDASMEFDAATREGEPSAAADVESDTTDAGEDDPYPLGSFPCANCQAIVAKGMLFCLRCKAPQTDESSKVTRSSLRTRDCDFAYSSPPPQEHGSQLRISSVPISVSSMLPQRSADKCRRRPPSSGTQRIE